jgi:hypothetical protein
MNFKRRMVGWMSPAAGAIANGHMRLWHAAKTCKKHDFKKTLEFNLKYDSLVSKIEGHNQFTLVWGKINKFRKHLGRCQVRGQKTCRCTHLTPRPVRFFIGGNKLVASHAFAMAGLMLKLLRFWTARSKLFQTFSNMFQTS